MKKEGKNQDIWPDPIGDIDQSSLFRTGEEVYIKGLNNFILVDIFFIRRFPICYMYVFLEY